jgi:tetratricopeptide (TPR) repeat protein
MNATCLNCLGEHPPALCPNEVGEHIGQATWVSREINLEALTWKRQTPQAMGWRTRLELDDDPQARAAPVSNDALLQQLSHRFTIHHALAVEAREGGVLERARKQRRLRAEVADRVTELIGQADAVLGTTARDRAARARRYLEAARDLDDLDPRVHLRLGFVLAQAGQHARAAEVFQQVADVLPQGMAPTSAGSAQLLAARAWFLAGQHKQAWEMAGLAEQALPNDGGVHYQKALIASRYAQANRSVKICLRRAVDLDPLYYTLAALDPAFEQAVWAEAVQPLLREVEDESIRTLIEQRDACRELFRELEDIVASPAFPQLPSSTGGSMEAGHDAHAETRSLLGWARGLLGSVEASFGQGPASRSALDGQLHQAQQRLKHWIQAWQRALMDKLQALAASAVPSDNKGLPPGAARHIQRITELMAGAEQLELGVGRSEALLQLERDVAREAHALDQLRKPKPTAKPKARSRVMAALGQVGFYLAVSVAVLAALGGDLLALHSPSFADHPFKTTAACAAFTVYLPEIVARLTRPRTPGQSWKLHELAFLPAYLLFPVLPAAAVVQAFPTAGMFMLMMAVSALMSLMLIVGMSAKR